MIGIRNFIRNASRILREAQEQNIHFVVMRHSEPVANITPIPASERDQAAADLAAIQAGIEDMEAGRTIPFEKVDAEIREELGLPPRK